MLSVLHDGAPNVGTAWVQDAYTQSELVLQSLKLAVEFLAPGGHFITKVFRSKDYNNLMWVFNQLFKRVEATKPPSSRNVSAEIFVVCQEYKAPRRIDPKFLDPQHVFKDLEPLKEGEDESMKGTSAANVHANVFEPEKKRRKREGYEEGNYTLYKAIPASHFIRQPDAVSMLGTYNQITFKDPEDKEILKHSETNEDIKANCEDLKVLGKKDFRNLMKWRLALREYFGLEAKKAEVPEETTETAEVEELDSDEEMDAELEKLTEEEQRKVRKERRRRNETRAKRVLKMQLQMTTPMDIGMEQGDESLMGGTDDFFDLKGTSKKDADDLHAEDIGEEDEAELTTITSGDDAEDEEDEKEARLRRLEGDMDGLYDDYQTRRSERDAKYRAKEERRKNKNLEEWHGINEKEGEDDHSDAESSVGGYDIVQGKKEKEETFDTDDEEDEAEEEEMKQVMKAEKRRRAALLASREAAAAEAKAGKTKKRRQRDDEDDEDEVDSGLVTSLESKKDVKARQSREAAIWFDNPLFKGVPGLDMVDDEEDDDDEEEDEEDEEESEEEDEDEESLEEDEEASGEEVDDESDFEVVPQEQEDDGDDWHVTDLDVDEEKRRFIEEHGLTTAEAITLAQQLVNREKSKADLIDQGFTKANFVDKTDLPSWFLDDEAKNWKANIPITKEAMNALRARQRALDARPIKKIAEAKARKKFKAAQRMSKAQKKAEDLLANEDGELTERDKASSISKLLARGAAKPKQRETKLVVAKGPNRGLKGRPKGVKGRFKMVDGRMKKELRAQKRIDKRNGKKVGGGRTKQKPRIPNGYGGR